MKRRTAHPAVEYHERYAPQALLIDRGGRIEHESYGNGLTVEDAHPLFSGTKSFWGVAALLAQADGLLRLDEAVAETIPSWSCDRWKRRVTLRDLLQLTAGVPFGGLGSAVPLYGKAVETELRSEPGQTFTYGGIPLQIFGAVFSRKLRETGMTPHDYLRDRILTPNGITIAKWRMLSDGTNPLPTGASLTARNWHKFGEYVLANATRLAECFRGSSANPRYGLCWWLAPPKTPADCAYASGAGGQGLYLVPSQQLIAVRFSCGRSFNHAVFLNRLTAAPP